MYVHSHSLTRQLTHVHVSQVPADKLRWAVGSIIAEGGEEPDFQLIGQYQEFGFKPFHTPAVSNAVKTSFPYTTPFSIFIAIFRVYPSLGAYIKVWIDDHSHVH